MKPEREGKMEKSEKWAWVIAFASTPFCALAVYIFGVFMGGWQ